MSFNKKFFTTGGIVAASEGVCLTEDVNPFTGEVADGGVALYSLDYDASDAGDTYNGTPTNVDFGVGGQINYGARFNGSSSYIDLGDTNLGITDDANFTISYWFNTNSITANQGVFWSQNRNSNGARFGSGINLPSNGGNGSIYFGCTTTSTIYINSGGSSYSANTWVHVVGVKSSSASTGINAGITLYVNGTEVANNASVTASASGSAATDNSIGSYGGTSSFFNGDLDQVRIFNRALTSNEVSTLYAETACVYDSTTDNVNYPFTDGTNVEAYYKLDNSSEDYVGSNDGTDTNIEYRFGRFGQAAVFNGSSSEITINSFTAPSNNCTTSLWFKANSQTDNQFILALNNTKRQAIRLNSTFNDGNFTGSTGADGRISYLHSTTGNDPYLDSASGLWEINRWYHLVIQKSSTDGAKIWLDGTEIASTTNTNDFPTVSGDNTIGSANGSFYFDGQIDQLRFFNSFLSEENIQKLYNEKQDYITKDASDPFGDSNSVALYEMENNGNDTLNNHNATSTAGVTFSATEPVRGTYAAEFSGGTSGSVVVPNSTDLAQQNNYTFSAWFKTDTTGVMQTIYAFNSSSTYQSAIYIHSNGTNNIRIFSAGSNYYSSDNIYTNNQWYHIAVTKSSTNGIVAYLDGVSIINEPTATANNVQPNAGDNRIGGYKTGSVTLTFDGELDQVRIFDRALDGTEAYQLYAEGARGTGL